MSPPQILTNVYSKVTFTHIVILSTLFRLALIIYGEYHDAHSVLKYTDIDYRVFSDAARFISNPDTRIHSYNHAKGIIGRHLPLGDPYARATYRYTPLLALLLVPNGLLPAFGKILFSLADILIGILLKRMLVLSKLEGDRQLPTKRSTETRPVKVVSSASSTMTRDEWLIAGIWLLDPFPANISTRGSSESILGLMVIVTLFYAVRGRWSIAAALLGLSVHWKIYPIVYVGSLIVFVGESTSPKRDVSSTENSVSRVWRWITNGERIKFALISASSFLFLSAAMYLIWGHPFLEHSYLYHIGRTDHRHNFSPYFYPLYLGLPVEGDGVLGDSQAQGRSRLLGLVAFIPQMLLSIGGGFWLASALPSSDHLPTPSATQTATSVQLNSQKRQNHVAGSQHLPFIFLIQTLVFVTLNKVCTSQYFMWYLWFLPLVVPHLIPRNVPNKTVATDAEQEKTTDRGNVEANGVSAYKAAWMIGLWVGSQALWLSQGYRLEFLGETVFVPLWAAGIVMLGVNSWLVSCLLKGYQIQ